MPLVKVEIVESADRARPHDVARSLADAIAKSLGSEPQSVWVRMVRIAAADYPETGDTSEGSETAVHLLYESPGRGRVAFDGRLVT